MRSSRLTSRAPVLVVVLALLFVQLACSLSAAQPTATPPPTDTATPTPPPTETPTPTATATNTPQPTPNYTATISARATSDAQAVLDLVGEDLTNYGVSTTGGHLEWQNKDPIDMTVTTYGTYRYEPVDMQKAADFVFQSEVQWDSTSGLAGCGLIFRADDDIKNGAHYEFVLMRLQFQPAWDIEYYKFGEWQATLTGKVLFSNAINDEPGSTNKIAIVTNGNEFTPYVNGEKLQTVTNLALKDGVAALLSYQESGKTECIFSNSWLWVIDD